MRQLLWLHCKYIYSRNFLFPLDFFLLLGYNICLATIGVCVFRALTSVGALFVLEEKMDIYRVSFIGHRYIDRLRLIEEKIQEIAVCVT